jgi:hypothetical protein
MSGDPGRAAPRSPVRAGGDPGLGPRAVVGAAVAAVVAVVPTLVRRPGLWPTVLRQCFRLARPGWWRRAPFLPLPPRDYIRFRLTTAYGGDGTLAGALAAGAEPGSDLVAYLEWCRRWERSAGRDRG